MHFPGPLQAPHIDELRGFVASIRARRPPASHMEALSVPRCMGMRLVELLCASHICKASPHVSRAMYLLSGDQFPLWMCSSIILDRNRKPQNLNVRLSLFRYYLAV